MSKKYYFTDAFKKELAERFISLGNNFAVEKKLPSTDINAPIDIIIMQDEKKWVLIELEIHRADPSNNIAKIAYWLSGLGKEFEITVIQVFTPHYDSKNGYKAKRKLSECLGKQLIKERYHQKYYPVSSQVMNKSDFEILYRSFREKKVISQESKIKLKHLVDDYIKQIKKIIE